MKIKQQMQFIFHNFTMPVRGATIAFAIAVFAALNGCATNDNPSQPDATGGVISLISPMPITTANCHAMRQAIFLSTRSSPPAMPIMMDGSPRKSGPGVIPDASLLSRNAIPIMTGS